MKREIGLMVALAAGCGGGTGASEGSSSGGESSTTTATSTGEPTTAGPTTAEPTTAGPSTDPTTDDPVGEPFTITALDKQWISGTGGWDTQHKDVELDLGGGTFASVKLVVDLETSCFPFQKWQDDPPPPGHNWPAKCDAFDRTMGFIFDPAAADADPPGFEALRSITPFGGPAHIEQDITDWANAHPGEHSLRSYINTWPDGAGQVSGSEGGWTLSVRLEVVPGAPPRTVLAALPLWQRDYRSDTGQLALPFTLPEGTTSTALVYTVSGHGGANDPSSACIGPAEEFCKREHHLLVDGAELSSFTAWRTDCSEYCTVTEHTWPDDSTMNYCAENPCGSIASVNAPRAQWCPGAVVEPLRGPLGVKAGEHTLGVAVDGVVPDGIWTMSVTVYAFGD